MIYIGYPTVEGLLLNTDEILGRHKPVYAMLSHTSIPLQIGLVRSVAAIVVARLDHGGIVHYCRIPLGSLELVDGVPLDQKSEWRPAGERDAWRIVEEWLVEQHYPVVNAVVAIPKDLVLLDGRADFLAYDPTARIYVRRPAQP